MKKFLIENKKNPYFWIFMVLSIGLFIAMPLMSLDAGNSGDEDGFQWPYGQQIYDFYASGGKDTTCLTNEDMGMHGGFFDQLTVVVVRWFNIEDYSQTRHIMNSLFGWVGVLFAALLAWKLKNWRTAILALLLMFLSPRLLGHSFNNPKDLIFSSMMIASLYYVVCLIKEYPKPTIKTSIKLAFWTALAIVSRFAGYLIFFYLVLGLIIYHILKNGKSTLKKNAWSVVGRYFIYCLCIAVGTFLMTIALWPYIMSSPIEKTLHIVTGLSQYNISLRQLFEGERIWSNAMPWYYTPKYIFSTIPVTVIIGLILFFIFCWRKKEERFWSFFVFFTFFFPIFWIVYTHANVYGGWRHAMFAYPPMVVAAACGIEGLLQWIEEKIAARKNAPTGENTVPQCNLWVTIVGFVLLLASLAGPIRHIVVNHPYEYVYFNELFGGIKKAYGNYELDYYYHSTREAAEWIKQNAEPKEDGSKIQVNSWHSASVAYFFRNDTADFKVGFSRWHEREYDNWDYAIFTVTGMQASELKNKDAFPPKNCVKTIDVDGYPICLILKKEKINYGKMGHDYLAKFQQHRLLDETGRTLLDTAKMYFSQALEQNPYNQQVLSDLISLNFSLNQMDSAKYYIDRALSFLADDEIINYNQGLYYLYTNDAQKAISSFKKVCKLNSKFKGGYTMLYTIYERTQDWKNAEKVLLDEMEIGQFGNQEFQQLMGVYAHQGLDNNSALKKIYKALYESFLKQGNKEAAEQYLEAYNSIKKTSIF